MSFTSSSLQATMTTTTTAAIRRKRKLTIRIENTMFLSKTIILITTIILFFIHPSLAGISCETDSDCQEAYGRDTTFCVDGSCSNPFAAGCLHTHDKTKYTKRVCRDLDGQDAVNCIVSDFNYTQLSIHHGNWETSIFYAWILEIILMELLEVPIAVGLNASEWEGSFYNPQSILHYSKAAYPFGALKTAHSVLDCRNSPNEDCAHVMPEVWNGQYNEWTASTKAGYTAPPEGNGMVGKGGWYVPVHTAESDDTLVSFYGLRGEENRAKLADAFRRPTNWLEYCETISTNNCSSPDDTAIRYPTDPSEQARYYSPPEFRGYFALTQENNCTLNPTTCHGHIVGPPCSWSTNVDGQLYHNNIVGIEPDGPYHPNGGYDYGQMVQIWRAANETKCGDRNCGVLLWWWKPEALIEEFDGQFQTILLPEATDVCSAHRVSGADRCSEDIWVRRGDPLGACDQEAHALQKVVTGSLRDFVYQDEIARRSPAYDVIQNLKLTDLQLNNMMRRWIAIGNDKYGNDAREAVCSWVVENLDKLQQTAIPVGYPRLLSNDSKYADSMLLLICQVVAYVATAIVLAAAAGTYYYRNARVFIYAQVYFVYLILFGSILLMASAYVHTLEPSTVVCTMQRWFVNLGYTIQVVPSLVKISAINKILQSAKKMRRVQISPWVMFSNVAMVVVGVLVFLSLWTVLDPPTAVELRVLEEDPDDVTTVDVDADSTQESSSYELEYTVVLSTSTCASESEVWVIISLGWVAVLFICATVLAVQSRNVMQEFNESRSLGSIVYSHFMFLILRIVLYLLEGMFEPSIVGGVYSLLLSLDTFAAICIYMVPKFIAAKTAPTNEPKRNVVTSYALSQIEAGAAAAQASYQQQKMQRVAAGNNNNFNGSDRNPNNGPDDSSNSMTSSDLKSSTSFGMNFLRSSNQAKQSNDSEGSGKGVGGTNLHVIKEGSVGEELAPSSLASADFKKKAIGETPSSSPISKTKKRLSDGASAVAAAALGMFTSSSSSSAAEIVPDSSSPVAIPVRRKSGSQATKRRSSAQSTRRKSGHQPADTRKSLELSDLILEKVDNNEFPEGYDDNASLSDSEESDDEDNGGPRYSNPAANTQLRRSCAIRPKAREALGAIFEYGSSESEEDDDDDRKEENEHKISDNDEAKYPSEELSSVPSNDDEEEKKNSNRSLMSNNDSTKIQKEVDTIAQALTVRLSLTPSTDTSLAEEKETASLEGKRQEEQRQSTAVGVIVTSSSRTMSLNPVASKTWVTPPTIMGTSNDGNSKRSLSMSDARNKKRELEERLRGIKERVQNNQK